MPKPFDDFSKHLTLERRLAKNTVDAYLSDLHFWELSGARVQAEMPPSLDLVLDCTERFLDQKLSESTMARRNAALRIYVKYRASLEDKKDEKWQDLYSRLPTVSGGESLPKAVGIEHIIQLLEFEVGVNPRLLRNRCLLEVLYATGLRVSELISLEWSQVDEQMQVLKILGKGSKERIVPYSERAAGWLLRYREEAWGEFAKGVSRRFSDWVFLGPRKKPLSRMGIWKILQERARVCGLSDIHPHVFRHSFATHLLEGGADVRFVQILLGHSSLNSTERYLKLSDNELKQMFEHFHPLG